MVTTKLLLLATLALLPIGCSRPPAVASPAPGDNGIAAAGLVEPAGEERVVIPELSGRLAHVYIDEGDTVTAGQLIGEIENTEYQAALAAAVADVARARATLDKLKHGARPEELNAAVASLDEARTQTASAASEFRRRESMLVAKLISREEYDQARAKHEAAQAHQANIAAQLALLRAGTRSEDIAAAEATLASAQAVQARADAILQKSRIRAPVDGSVLKRDLREGETVVSLSPIPLARIGDLSKRFVRADVDELDIRRVKVGQTASITSDSFPGEHFPGKIVRVSQRMGRRNSSSDDPAQRQDVKILECSIELDGQPPLPIGLRVDVRIATGSK